MPPLCAKIGLPVPVGGGWLYSSAKAVLDCADDLNLAIATAYSGKELQIYDIDGIKYYLLPTSKPTTKYDSNLEYFWKQVNYDFHPDLVHLHGTEYAHGLSFLNACPEVESVVSIQGLVSVLARYYLAGFSRNEVRQNMTLRDVLKGSLLANQRSFFRRGKFEQEIIRKTHNIIGRTSWDRAHTWAINPNASYHFCNETLRSSFYGKKWDYSQCEPYSIFISQAGYPVKGLHQVLKALPLVLKQYPQTKVYVGGANIIDRSSLSKKIRFSGYGKYISRLIKKYQLQEHVIFLGSLSEKEMSNRYLKSNVFVSPSSIENSPNSLGEAQLLGMPVVASYVGGVPDMMKGYEEWMYRFEEVEMLAEKLCSVFSMKDYTSFSNSNACKRHDKVFNSQTLYNIYNIILDN